MDSRLADFQRAFAEVVTRQSGAGWIRLPAARVLLHQGHVAPGVFVVVTGSLGCSGPGACQSNLPAPCVVPPFDAWSRPSAASWTVTAECDVLFVPRSRLLEDVPYRQRLEGLINALCPNSASFMGKSR